MVCFTSLGVFMAHPHWSTYYYFCGSTVFHYMAEHIFFIHSSIDGLLRCLHILVTVNNAAMNIGTQCFISYNVFISFGYILGVK